MYGDKRGDGGYEIQRRRARNCESLRLTHSSDFLDAYVYKRDDIQERGYCRRSPFTFNFLEATGVTFHLDIFIRLDSIRSANFAAIIGDPKISYVRR